MFKRINFFKLSVYLSIPFLLWTLYKFDYLVIPKITNLWSLLISFLFLFAGFILTCENWRITLKHDKIIYLSKKESIVSNGLSIFTKYIPGKFLSVFSRALYINKKYGLSLKKLTYTSLKTQLVSIWIGLLVGGVILLKISIGIWIKIIAIIFLLSFFIFFFSKKSKEILASIAKKHFKRNLDYPILDIKQAQEVFPSFVMNWIFWCIGFYFLSQSIVTYDISIWIGISFAFASVIAILAIFAPGGIGVREAILITFLIALGIEKQDAITVSVVSRLWFIIGEVFIFLLATILRKSL